KKVQVGRADRAMRPILRRLRRDGARVARRASRAPSCRAPGPGFSDRMPRSRPSARADARLAAVDRVLQGPVLVNAAPAVTAAEEAAAARALHGREGLEHALVAVLLGAAEELLLRLARLGRSKIEQNVGGG